MEFIKGNDAPRNRKLHIGKLAIPEKVFLLRYWVPLIIVIASNFLDLNAQIYTSSDGHIHFDICPDSAECNALPDHCFGDMPSNKS
jgi:hypothetical protein